MMHGALCLEQHLVTPLSTQTVVPLTWKMTVEHHKFAISLASGVLKSKRLFKQYVRLDDRGFVVDMVGYYFLPVMRDHIIAYYKHEGPQLRKMLNKDELVLYDTQLSGLLKGSARGDEWLRCLDLIDKETRKK